MNPRTATVLGPILILIGVLMLLGQLGLWSIGFSWPIVIVLVGLGFLLQYLRSRSDGGSLFSGVLLLLMGSFFQAHEWFGFYMDEVWPFFPTAVGVAFIVTGIVHPGKRGSIGLGFLLVGVGMLGWAITVGLFEWLIRAVFRGIELIFTVGIPLALIAWGAWLLLSRRGGMGGGKGAAPEKVEPELVNAVSAAPPSSPSASPLVEDAEFDEESSD